MRRVCGFARFRRCAEVLVRKATETGRSIARDSGLRRSRWRAQRKDAALGGEEESAADLMRNATYR